MATKAQEKEALGKIQKIVTALGPDSYLELAFDGVFELALENIENDFGNSCGWYISQYHKLTDELKKVRTEFECKEKKLCDIQAAAEKEFKDRLGEKDRIIARLDDEIRDMELSRTETAGRSAAAGAHIQELESKLKSAELEIIRLKAKLFDTMFSGD